MRQLRQRFKGLYRLLLLARTFTQRNFRKITTRQQQSKSIEFSWPWNYFPLFVQRLCSNCFYIIHYSDMSRNYSDMSRLYKDMSRLYKDMSRHYSNMSRHYSDMLRHYRDMLRFYSDKSHHYRNMSRHYSHMSCYLIIFNFKVTSVELYKSKM